jgi:Cu-processing system ATP-binding protein
MMPRPIILDHVSKSFGRQPAVRAVDLSLAPGECVGLVGHNGAGKSTLIKLMLGLLRPTEGRVSVLGEDPAHGGGARARREIGYLPENVALYPALSGAETMVFYGRLKGEPPGRARALLDRVGLPPEIARRRVGTYSKGMRQRLALAQAMLGNPRALLLDEPTSGLDPALRQSFYELLRELRGTGTTVLLSSHALAELEGQVDRVVVINQGRKMADGDLAQLRELSGVVPRLRVRLASAAPVAARAALGGWQAVAGGWLECACREEQIAERLRGLPEAVASVEILRPSLDELYAAFLRRPEAAA